jgi:ankyrin repeat protein
MEAVLRINWIFIAMIRLIIIQVISLCFFMFTGKADDSKAVQTAKNGTIADIQSLLDQGMSVDKPLGKFQNTMLQIAVMYQNEDVVRLLIERGADPGVKDSTGFTTYEYLDVLERRAGVNREKAISSLRQQGISESVIQGNYPEIDANGRDFTARGAGIWDRIGSMLPVKKNNLDRVTITDDSLSEAQRLNEYFGGLNSPAEIINLQDSMTGETVLLRTMKAKPSLEAIRILLAYGANPTISDHTGKAASDYASLIKNESLRRDIQYLLFLSTSSRIKNQDPASRNQEPQNSGKATPVPDTSASQQPFFKSETPDIIENDGSESRSPILPVAIGAAVIVGIVIFILRRKST